MYCKYSNFKLTKKKNFVGLHADEICVLEKVEDDSILEYKKPHCLINIIHEKLLFLHTDQYYIYTLKVPFYNSVTDYKKIWKMGEFENPGIFEGQYDYKNDRIYFGIYKGTLPHTQNNLLNRVSLFVPAGTSFSFEKVFDIFEASHFDTVEDKKIIIDTLIKLQESIKDSIVIYEFPRHAEIYVLGQDIEYKFDASDLPNTEIIER